MFRFIKARAADARISTKASVWCRKNAEIDVCCVNDATYLLGMDGI